MVVVELLRKEGDLYIYEYRPWDNKGRGEFAMTAEADIVGYSSLAEDDEDQYYFEYAVNAIVHRYNKTGEMPQKVVRVWQ